MFDNCLHPSLAARFEIRNYCQDLKWLPVFSRRLVWPPCCGWSDRCLRAGLTGGVWPVWQAESETDSIFVGSRVFLLGKAYFGFPLVSTPNWTWWSSCRRQDQLLFKGQGRFNWGYNLLSNQLANWIVLLLFSCNSSISSFIFVDLCCKSSTAAARVRHPFVGLSRKPSVCPQDG